MDDTIESELAAMNEANLAHLIPSHIFNHFKIELNDRILTGLIGDLDHLLQTSDANSSFKILTLNDNSEYASNSKRSHNETTDSDVQNDTTISSLSSSSFINKNSKSFLVEMASRLLEIFTSYHNSLARLFVLFDQERQRQAQFDRNNNKTERLATKEELIVYQRAILVQKLSRRHYNLLNLLFRHAFDFYNKENNIKDDEDEENEEDGDEEEEAAHNESSVNMMDMSDDQSKATTSKKPNLIEKFHEINRILFNLEIFDHLCGDIVVEVVQNKIRQHIENTSMDNYEESFIKSFEIWLEKIIIGWIKLVYQASPNEYLSNPNETVTSDKTLKFDQYLQNYKKQLAHFMYTHYAHVRIKRLFDIIIDFPDSKCAVDDLKICLEKTNLRTHVVKVLKASIEQRLLHPGVNTSDILTAYVSAIKALMCLDSSGVMMENICQPLKKYLRNREDTVKCIVSSLTDDGESSNEIMEEFCKDLYSYEGSNEVIDSNTAAPIQLQSNAGGGDTPRLKAWEQWMPDPVDALSLAGDNSNLLAKSNIISMLVNIYGSKDMFVNEYKTLLADRLLSNYSYNMEKEIRNLELLKLRFGDSNLFACEAMLKDISESKRINTNILEQLRQNGVDRIESFVVKPDTLKCIILSEQFWPKLKEEKIEMPHELKLIQEKFMGSYEAFKGNRTLIWKNNLGLVTIDLEINGKTTEYVISPLHAAIIMKFQERESWSLLELSQSLKMCSFALRKKLTYWKIQGLIKEQDQKNNQQTEAGTADGDSNGAANEIYTLVKDGAKLNKSRGATAFVEDEEENEKTAQSSEILKDQDLTLYWNYTQGMLRGCGCLPLERIHSWLKLYANPDLTIEQVRYLVEVKTKEQLLKYNAGLYRLNK